MAHETNIAFKPIIYCTLIGVVGITAGVLLGPSIRKVLKKGNSNGDKSTQDSK